MLGEVESGHLCGSDLGAGRVVPLEQVGGDREAGPGGGGADVVEDKFPAEQRATGPVLADFAEEAVFDGVVLGLAWGIVCDADGEAVGIAEAMLQAELPGAGSVAVAAATVGEEGQLGGVGVAGAAGGAPPVVEAVDGKEGRVMGLADKDRAGIGVQVVDAVGHSEAARLGAEVVVVDADGLAFPSGTGILEVPDKLFFLGVNAD